MRRGPRSPGSVRAFLETGSDGGSPSRETVELLKKLGLSPVFKETTGGHTWINWQNYLNEFAPQLFQ